MRWQLTLQESVPQPDRLHFEQSASQTLHMGWDSLLPSSSLRSVLGLVSVLLQEKDQAASIWELGKTALMTAHEPSPSASKINKSLGPILSCYTSKNLSNYSPSSTERLTAESHPLWFQA